MCAAAGYTNGRTRAYIGESYKLLKKHQLKNVRGVERAIQVRQA